MHHWAAEERRPDGKKTYYRANRALALVSSMYIMAVEEGWCASNPAKGIERYPEDEREVWLTDEQLAALDTAINEYRRDIGDAVRLLILTGCRACQARHGRWMSVLVRPAPPSLCPISRLCAEH